MNERLVEADGADAAGRERNGAETDGTVELREADCRQLGVFLVAEGLEAASAEVVPAVQRFRVRQRRAANRAL